MLFNQSEDLKLANRKHYFAQFQIASYSDPSYKRGIFNNFIIDDDLANLLLSNIQSVLPPNYTFEYGSTTDLKHHNLIETYLSDRVYISGDIGNGVPTRADEVFRGELTKLAEQFPPNCCFQYVNGNYEISSEELVPFGNGFVSPDITSIPASVNLQGASICSGVTLGENVTLSANVTVSGKVFLENCSVATGIQGASVEIIGAPGNGVKISGPIDVADGTSPGSGLFILVAEGSLKITGSDTLIENRGQVVVSSGVNSIDNALISMSLEGPYTQPSHVNLINTSIGPGSKIIDRDDIYSLLGGAKKLDNCVLNNSMFISSDSSHSCIRSTITNSIIGDSNIIDSDIAKSIILGVNLNSANKNDNSCDESNINLAPKTTTFNPDTGVTTTCYNSCYYPSIQAGCFDSGGLN